jgi:hypothetical protein
MQTFFDESDPRVKGLNTYYGREIRWQLGEFEKNRKKARSRAAGIAAIGVVFGAAGGASGWLYGWIGVVPGIIGLILLIRAYTVVVAAKSELKKFLVDKLCGFFDLDYRHDDFAFPLERFDQLGLVPDFNRSSLEDHISGQRDGAPLRLADAHLRMRSGSGKSSSTKTVFRGPLFIFDWPHDFNGTTLVTDDRGGLLNRLRKLAVPGDPVPFEDADFEKRFEVFSTDANQARALLDTHFRQRLMALDEQVGMRRIRCAFETGQLLVSLRTNRNMFEAGSLFGASDDAKRIDSLIAELTTVFDVMEGLGLAEGRR